MLWKCAFLVPFWKPTKFRSTWYQWAMSSIGEVPPHEKTGHQNWPTSYAECRANVVQMNACSDERLRRMAWSMVSKADVKSSMTNTTTQPRSTAYRMSLWTIISAVSVEWFCRYADWNWSCKSFSCKQTVSCFATTRSIILEINGRFDIA